MTVTYTNGVFTVTSTEFAETYEKATLYSTINCEGDYSIEIQDGDLSGNNYAIDNQEFYSLEELSRGLYYFKLVFEYAGSSSVRVEEFCYFIDDDLLCEIVEKVTSEQDVSLQLDHFLVYNASLCNCNCTNFCTIYKRIRDELSDCTSC